MMGRHVHRSWIHLRGATRPGQEKLVGHVVAQGGSIAAVQLGAAMRRSSSTQMLREHTHGSRIHRKVQSEGQALGRAPQSGALLLRGQTVPGQIADSFNGKRQRLGAIEDPSGPVTLMAQLLQPSGEQDVMLIPLHCTVAHASAASSAGHTKGPCPSAQHCPALQGRRKPGGSMLGEVDTGRQVQGSCTHTSEAAMRGSSWAAVTLLMSLHEKFLGHS